MNTKLLRLAILRWSVVPKSPDLLVQYARGEGMDWANPEVIAREIKYLCHPSKGFLEAVTTDVAPNDALYQTTPKGQDELGRQP